MAFLTNIQSIFTNALSNAKKIDDGKKINFAPKSDRYTYNFTEDNDYNKDWKPTTPEEKKKLTPKGYHRVRDRKAVKEDMLQGIFNAALEKQRKENPEQEENESTLAAEREAQKLFDERHIEKNISIPSTALKNVKYNPKTEGLFVKFQGGKKEYFYPNVPLEVIQGLLRAPSKGEYFLKNIHDQYTLNPGHKRAGKSTNYMLVPSGRVMSKRQVNNFFKKYSKAYEAGNKKRMQKLAGKVKSV